MVLQVSSSGLEVSDSVVEELEGTSSLEEVVSELVGVSSLDDVEDGLAVIG